MDVLLFGDPTQPILAQNFSPATNTPPTAPAGLQASVSGSGVVMNWNAATDAETPPAGLSYNVRVGTTPGGINIVSPEADTANGFRRVPQLGNSQEALLSILTNLPAGTYYWSVQAIDTSFAGSPFAPECQFTIGGPEPITGATGLVTSASAIINGTVNPNGHDTTTWFQWGTNATYGSNGPLVFVSGTNTGPVAVSLSLTGLSSLTQYSYRLTASNSVGQNYGGNRVFVTPPVLAPQINQISSQGDGAILLQFSGESALSYTLLASTNFVDWAPVTNLTADVNGVFQFTTDSTNYPARFFRVRRP